MGASKTGIKKTMRIYAWVTEQTKDRLVSCARLAGLSESAMLAELIRAGYEAAGSAKERGQDEESELRRSSGTV